MTKEQILEVHKKLLADARHSFAEISYLVDSEADPEVRIRMLKQYVDAMDKLVKIEREVFEFSVESKTDTIIRVIGGLGKI